MTFTNGDFVYTTFDSPLDNYNFVSLDDALAELTELTDQIEYQKLMLRTTTDQLANLRNGLHEFVKENHDATDASALIEQLCEEFSIDASRRVTATVNVQYTVILDAPYTKTIDEVEEDISGLDYRVDIRHMSDYDVIDAYVEDIDVADIDED